MIKNNKTTLIISSLITLSPILIGLILWNSLPEAMTTHWGIDGAADGSMSRALAVFLMPLLLLGLHWLCVMITARDEKNLDQNGKVVSMVLWIVPIISLVTSGIIYAVAMGAEPSVVLFIIPILAIMFIIIGNYLPKCKQNNTIGIKLVWTLANEENWNATHRLAGRVWFIGGFLMLPLMLAPDMIAIFAVLPIAIMLGLIPTVYSYLYYQKQVKEGRAEPKPKMNIGKGSKIAGAVGVAVTCVILALCLVLIFTGDILVDYGDDSLSVRSSYWGNTEISYSEIDNVEYRNDFDYGTRLFGFGTPRLLAGSFKCDELGTYTCYAYTPCSAAVIIKVDDRFIVINGESSEQTIAIYNEISERLGE